MSFAEGYIDVATRIAEFRAKYPEGSLQPADPTRPFTVETIGGKERVVSLQAWDRREHAALTQWLLTHGSVLWEDQDEAREGPQV